MSCPACFSGHVDDRTPKGREETIHGRPTYVAEPSEGTRPKGIIVMIPDAFGFPFVNNRIWVDHIASAGDFRVYLPEFMDGNAAPVSMINSISGFTSNKTSIFWKPVLAIKVTFQFIPFIIANRWSLCWPRITSFLKAVRENEGASLPVGVAGFCWGGRYVVYLAHDEEKAGNGKSLIDASFAAHPSNLSLPTELQKIKLPVSIAIGDKDFVMPMNQVEEAKKIWGEKNDVDTDIKVYKDAEHGFAVRADFNTPDAVQKAEEAEKQAVEWFKKQFAKVSS